MRTVRPLSIMITMALALSMVGASCGQQGVLLMPGLVNSSGNRSLRRAIFRFATDSLCSEMRKSSVPLKFREADPSIGRFYPVTCAVRELANENLFVELTGHGYAWTNITGRMGFTANAAVEYDHDFLVDGSSMYVYFRQASTQRSELSVRMVERNGRLAGATLTTLLGGGGANVQQVAQRIGSRILKHQLGRGFTVVRESNGDTSFALGVLEKGETPLVPFDRADSSWPLLANDRSELHSGQRDYVGPFYVRNADDTLYLTAVVEGAAAVDVMVVNKQAGDAWLGAYEQYPNTGAPPGPALFQQPFPAAMQADGSPQSYRQQLRLPTGAYYVVFDHTNTAGATAPPNQVGDDRAALISYAVQLGEAK